MGRYRLRFLFQEFEIGGPTVVIGRSPDCHITIEDPLVSRRHAEIHVRDEDAWIVDLGSRNGVKVNGQPIKGESPLVDGDRIRLGTQEFVFNTVGRRDKPTRPTGFMLVCTRCRTPFPEQAECPHCGAPSVPVEEETMTGTEQGSARTWAVDMMLEVIDRALRSDVPAKAVQLLEQLSREIDESLLRNQPHDPSRLGPIIRAAIQVSATTGDSRWIRWALTTQVRAALSPTVQMVEELERIPVEALTPDTRRAIEDLARWCRDAQLTLPAGDVLARLDRLAKPAPAHG